MVAWWTSRSIRAAGRLRLPVGEEVELVERMLNDYGNAAREIAKQGRPRKRPDSGHLPVSKQRLAEARSDRGARVHLESL